MAFYQFFQEQRFNRTVEELWDFISSPANLKEITPDYMGFEITTPNLPEKMYAGMIIGYKVSPMMGIKMDWLTEITQVKEQEFFIDEQRVGPYAMWHHQHHLIPIEKGVYMKDIITYQPPFGFLGAISKNLMIEKKLNEIFNYRRVVLEKRFGTYQNT
ncbi:SRPBCC family protein [Namhaeicola litoreus]|uniref:Ligand-binding SRPBCC domain-containing protein n=1 Tax=Namhaeicola litoreus TaxID=1052145 RepID=A0ABW3Y2H2_9FLAO